MIDSNGKPLEPERDQQVMDHQQRFNVCRVRLSPNRVKVALDELAIPTSLRIFAAPNRGDVISLERHSERRRVLCGKPG